MLPKLLRNEQHSGLQDSVGVSTEDMTTKETHTHTHILSGAPGSSWKSLEAAVAELRNQKKTTYPDQHTRTDIGIFLFPISILMLSGSGLLAWGPGPVQPDTGCELGSGMVGSATLTSANQLVKDPPVVVDETILSEVEAAVLGFGPDFDLSTESPHNRIEPPFLYPIVFQENLK